MISDVVAIMTEIAAPRRIKIDLKPLPMELIIRMDLIRTQ